MPEKITYTPIGVVHSPYKEPEGTPIQPAAGAGVTAEVELYPEFEPGLKDLDGFSHIILICHLHLARKAKLTAKPFMDDTERGIFAIRGPSRPNPIGISIVRLKEIKGSMIVIEDVDIVDGTPVLDIKPYVPRFDESGRVRIGWLESKIDRLPRTRDDGRFTR